MARKVNVPVPADLREQVITASRTLGKSVSEWVREALEAYQVAPREDAGGQKDEYVTVRLDADLYQRLQARADAERRSIASVIRAAIRMRL